MIQTKFPVICNQRNQRTAIVKVEVRPMLPTSDDGQKFLVVDWDMDNLENALSSKEVFWTNEQINQMEDYLEANNDFSLLTRVEKERKKLQLALMIDTASNLLPNGKTIYGLTPSDWELSE